MSDRNLHSIQLIIESIEKIQTYISAFSNAADFYQDGMAFDAVLMNFINIGEMVDRLTDDFREKHNDIPWHKIKSFRNIIAHDYFGVDADEVWQIVNKYLNKFYQDIISLK